MTLDPQMIELRRSLGRFRRRLWLRRVVRNGSLILAGVLVIQLGLAIVARLMPFEWHAFAAALVVLGGLVALLIDAVRVRPTLAEAALAADSEDGLSDRVSTALALASVGPAPERDDSDTYEHLVRLQRHDALSSLETADPRGLRIPFPRRQGAVAALAGLLLVPALLLPNIQNDVLAQRERMRDAAQQQAERIEETANRLATGRTSPDPRADLAEELRRLARELRDRPEDLDQQLARLGSLEDALRSQIDPANEQRAAAITSLSRSLSRAATGSDSNPQGDPQKTNEDLDDLKDRLPEMSDEERDALARQLAEMDSTARQAGANAQTALERCRSRDPIRRRRGRRRGTRPTR